MRNYDWNRKATGKELCWYLGIPVVLAGLGISLAVAKRLYQDEFAPIGQLPDCEPRMEIPGTDIEEAEKKLMEKVERFKAEMEGKLEGKVEDGKGDEFEQEIYERLRKHEGKRFWVYDDETGKRLKPGEKAEGKRTIGVGFNLEKEGARKRIEDLGLNYRDVAEGRLPLTNDDIEKLFEQDKKTAEADARKYMGEAYDNLSSDAQEVLTNMAFNLGYGGLSGFKNMREALLNQDYQRAAEEMIDSKWYNQTGNRSRELVDIMRNADKSMVER